MSYNDRAPQTKHQIGALGVDRMLGLPKYSLITIVATVAFSAKDTYFAINAIFTDRADDVSRLPILDKSALLGSMIAVLSSNKVSPSQMARCLW